MMLCSGRKTCVPGCKTEKFSLSIGTSGCKKERSSFRRNRTVLPHDVTHFLSYDEVLNAGRRNGERKCHST